MSVAMLEFSPENQINASVQLRVVDTCLFK